MVLDKLKKFIYIVGRITHVVTPILNQSSKSLIRYTIFILTP